MMSLTAATIAAFMALPANVGAASTDESDADNGSRQQKAHAVMQPVINPRVPESMKFAGEHVDLKRADMFEKLDRELTSMA